MWDLSSKTRDQTCIGRWILDHWTTREALHELVFKRIFFSFYTPFKKLVQKQTASHRPPGNCSAPLHTAGPETWAFPFACVQFSSVQSLSHARFFVTPWSAALQASLSITNSWSLLKLMSIESVMPSNHLILCHPLLMPSVFPSIRVFSNESVLCIRWCPCCHGIFLSLRKSKQLHVRPRGGSYSSLQGSCLHPNSLTSFYTSGLCPVTSTAFPPEAWAGWVTPEQSWGVGCTDTKGHTTAGLDSRSQTLFPSYLPSHFQHLIIHKDYSFGCTGSYLQDLLCSMWDLIPWPGMEPGPLALGVQTLSHWTTREVPFGMRSCTQKGKVTTSILQMEKLSHKKEKGSSGAGAKKKKKGVSWWIHLKSFCFLPASPSNTHSHQADLLHSTSRHSLFRQRRRPEPSGQSAPWPQGAACRLMGAQQ